MPRLPTFEQLGQTPVPRERGKVVPLNLATPRPSIMAAPGQALAEVGGAMDELSAALRREQLRADTLRVDDAYIQYSQQLLALELDPEQGFSHKRGRDAVKGKLVQTYRARRDEIRGQIEESLANAEQKMLFNHRAAVADQAFDGKLYRHLAGEMDRYQAQVFESMLAQKRMEAALGWDQPRVLETALVETNAAIERQAERLGLDDKTVAQMKREAESSLHGEVIDRMLLNGQDDAALAYYRKVKKRLLTQEAARLDQKLKTASVYGQASRTVDEVWAQQGPQHENDPVRLFTMERELRHKLRGNAATVREAVAQLRQRAAAWDAEQRQLADTRKAQVLGAFNEGKPLEEVTRTPEFQALDSITQDALLAHLRQRSMSGLVYEEWLKAQNGHVLYWQYSNPQVLAGMSEENIIALEPKIGQEYVASLLSKKRTLTKPGAVAAATIDADLFKYLAKESGINAYKPSPEEKKQLGRLKYVVEGQIDRLQTALGRKLKREEKETLMRQILDQEVIKDRFLLPDKPVKAALVMPEEYEDIYVPLNQIPEQWLQEHINYMRSVGVISPQVKDSEARRLMKDRLEHAYAVYKVGGGEALVARLLQGVPTEKALEQR